MAKKTQHASTKRFGPRYGRTTKQKVGKIEHDQHKSYPCPYCHYTQVKRVSSGIWECRKCTAKFASKAYSVAKLPLLKGE